MACEFNLPKDQVRYRLAKLKKEGYLTRSGTQKGMVCKTLTISPNATLFNSAVPR